MLTSELLAMLDQHKLLREVIHSDGSSSDGSSSSIPTQVTCVCYDSRKASNGGIFVAIQGVVKDGHLFIASAVQSGARIVVCERLPEFRETKKWQGDVLLVLVKDSRKALAAISHGLLVRALAAVPAHALASAPKPMRVIGVTGTNGKTTTTFILKALLEACGETVGVIGTTGNYIGGTMLPADFTTPESPELCALMLQMHDHGATAIVMEVSSHALQMERVYGVNFAGAIFTNLTQDHLDFHKTMDEYAAAKQRLFTMLDASAVAVVNADDDRAEFMIAGCKAVRTLRFGRRSKNSSAEIQIYNEELDTTQTRFSLASTAVASSAAPATVASAIEGAFTMSLVGRFNIDNATGCIALCALLYADSYSSSELLTRLQRGIQAAQPAPGRMQRIVLPNGAAAVVDYAHTPDALEKALLSCKELLEPSARLICMFGCGGDRDRTKRPLMGAIAVRLAHEVVITSDNPRTEDPESIIADILEGATANVTASITVSTPTGDLATTPMISVQADRAKAIHYALSQARKGDLVLVAGKGHEDYQIIGTEKIHFDDAEQIRAFAG